MREIVWLHISDLHLRAATKPSQDIVLNALNDSIENEWAAGTNIDFILVTGDLAFSGKEEEYTHVRDFFDALAASSRVTKERIFCVPGNHDVNRDVRKLCFSGIRTELKNFEMTDWLLSGDNEELGILRHRLKNYNVQNAVDAVLLQAKLENIEPSHKKYCIVIEAAGNIVSIKDNGIGMSRDDLQSLFWTMGASGKRTPEARAAGCVGTFGIGGFANFGICDKLEVFSKTEADVRGTLTYLTKTDIQEAGSSLPRVTYEDSEEVKERGTIVRGYLRNEPDIEEIRRYLSGFVRFVPIAIFFNKELLSKQQFNKKPGKDNFKEIIMNPQWMSYAGVSIKGQFYEDRGHSLAAFIDGLEIDGKPFPLSGEVRIASNLYPAN